MIPAAVALVLAGLVAAWGLVKFKQRHAERWFPSLMRGDWAGRREAAPRSGPVHVLFCVADHYEPGARHAPPEKQIERVEHWTKHYPKLFSKFRDADGRPPRHTFFFPSEQYRPEVIERLGGLVQEGFGEVEVHLHHDRDTSGGLRATLREFVERLRSHGHLGEDTDGRARFGFVHGNWCLDNSMPDGSWCGVNDELRVLSECGCYADFTLPSAPSPAQTRRVNSIYYATDDPDRPFSHNDGVEARAGVAGKGDLLLIQGPLAVLWTGGKLGLLPRLENGNLTSGARLSPRRLNAWVNARVCVAGRPDWLFIKVHTHGAVEDAWPTLLGEPMLGLHDLLQRHYNDGSRHVLHYVTAREMFNVVRAAERGLAGDPGRFRDIEIAPPARAGVSSLGDALEAAS
jgi:hypothetical protein